MLQIAFFENDNSDQFRPLTYLRPSFELVCGRFSLRERITRWFQATHWFAFLRDSLADSYQEAHPKARVNELDKLSKAPTLLINGRWIPDINALHQLRETTVDAVGILEDTVVYLKLDPDEGTLISGQRWEDELGNLARRRHVTQASGQLAHHPWDLINLNGEQLINDFEIFNSMNSNMVSDFKEVALLGNREQISISPSADIDPFVVIDARSGPVTIDSGAKIQAFTRIEGPCHIGAGSQLFRANIKAGTSIGPACRVGGEIEESILHAFANKYHDGFLGHSYICPWVNLGAMTTNSDVKNDYSLVRVPLAGEILDTNLTKVGCFVGDHTKTALGSLFNTGSSIGVMSMILPGGELLPKHVPSFSRVWFGALDDGIDLDSVLQTAAVALSRRHQKFTPAQERLLRHTYELTQPERTAAVTRFQQKLVERVRSSRI